MSFIRIIFLLLPVFVLHGCTRQKPAGIELYVPIIGDDFTYSLNKQLACELMRRVPKTYPFCITESPRIHSSHRLIEWFECRLTLLNRKISTQREAIHVALPYAQAFIDTLNNTREIRPYLMEFPCPLALCGFCIGFVKDPKPYSPFPPPNIANLFFFGKKRFEIREYVEEKDRTRQEGNKIILLPLPAYKNVYPNPEEYPESFLQLETPRIDKRCCKEPIAIPEAKTYIHFNSSGRSEFRLFKELAHKNDLIFIALGEVFPMAKSWASPICPPIAMAGQEKRLSLEEVRALVIKIRNSEASFYMRNKWLPDRINEARKQGKESVSNLINAQKYLGLRISFWDKYINRIAPPHIAEVQVYGTQARYYVSDELQRLVLIHEEDLPPYEVEIPVPKDVLKTLSVSKEKK